MTNGWDAVRRVPLAEPWEAFWVDVYVDPPIGVYLGMQKAAAEALTNPTAAAVDALVKSLEPLIGDHNMVDRQGDRLAFGIAGMGAKLIVCLKNAVASVVDDDGATADPLPPKRKAPSSRGSASRRGQSPRTTPSGASPG